MVKLEELYEVDREGKEIALKFIDYSDRLAYYSARRFLHKLQDSVNELRKLLLMAYGYDTEVDDALYYLYTDFSAAIKLTDEKAIDCSIEGKSFRECDSTLKPPIEELNKTYEYTMEKLTGKRARCAWGIDSPVYNLSMAINDLTSCYHGLLEEYAKKKMDSIGIKAYAREDATDRAKEACKIWDKETEKARTYYLYRWQDYEALQCLALNDFAHIKVGDSPGHRTEVNLKEDKIVYYDTDEEVNLIMYKLLTETGLKCKVDLNEKVECTGFNKLPKDKRDKVLKILSYSTSMDFRVSGLINGLIRYTTPPYAEDWADAYRMYPGVRECFPEDGEKILDREFHDKKLRRMLDGICESKFSYFAQDACKIGIAMEACAVKKMIELEE